MLVVTMTSWTARINNVLAILKNLLKQTVIPDQIFLNLSETEFKDIKLPQNLTNFIKKHEIIKLNWVSGPNTRSFKKIFPILHFLSDDDIIINVDDDLVLPPTFIESRFNDFKKYNTCISGLQNEISSYAQGRLLEVKHYLGAGSVYQKKMFKHWDELLCPEVINTNHDDAFYCFLCWLNGYVPESCSEFDSKSLELLAAEETSLHGHLGCAGPVAATQTNVVKFLKLYKVLPHYNFFRTNKAKAVGPVSDKLKIDNGFWTETTKNKNYYLYF